ncbi:MAG: hypothetical protein ACT7A5_15955 [Ferrovibrionaceae bacterium]
MATRNYVGNIGYLARTCGRIHVYCDHVRPGFSTLREALCGHSVVVTPADLLTRYGPEMTVQAWAEKLRCSRCGSGDHVELRFHPPSHEYRDKS